MASDWREIENDKEKYAAYLCSREWGVLKEAVRTRAGGTCERCRVLPIDATHHLTYARKYNENIEDLQGICNHCHGFTHAKSTFDPLANNHILHYMIRCKDKGIAPIPSVMAAKEAGVMELASPFNAVVYMIDLIDAEYKKIEEFTVLFDNINGAKIYSVLGPMEDAAFRIQREYELPFDYAGWTRWTGRTRVSVQDYLTAAKILGVKIPDDSDCLAPCDEDGVPK